MLATDNFKCELIAALPRGRRFAFGLSGSEDVADELVQQACERALTRWEQYQPGTRLDRWFLSIVNSIWKNELRSVAIRRGAGFVDAEAALVHEESFGQHADAAAATRALLDLPEAQRAALILVYMEGYTYSEAAEIEDVAIGTIMSRLARGRQRLSERFAQRTVKQGVSQEEARRGR